MCYELLRKKYGITSVANEKLRKFLFSFAGVGYVALGKKISCSKSRAGHYVDHNSFEIIRRQKHFKDPTKKLSFCQHDS